MNKKLTELQIKNQATALGIEIASLRAVIKSNAKAQDLIRMVHP